MSRIDSKTTEDTPAWSARNLPLAKPSRTLRFSVMAVAAGLVAIVLASAVKNPLHTAGTQMEPSRFTSTSHLPGKAAATGFVVAADAK